MNRAMDRLVRVAIDPADPHALKALGIFLNESPTWRPRSVVSQPDQGTAEGAIVQIAYGIDGKRAVDIPADQRVQVEVQFKNGAWPDADYYVLSAPAAFGMGDRYFSTVPARTAVVRSIVPAGKEHFVLNAGRKWSDARYRDVANQLAAAITKTNIWRPDVLSFPFGDASRHFRTVLGWLTKGEPITLMSGICLHATENRRQIVSSLDEDILSALARAAKCAFAPFPNVERWVLSTFGPADYDWLGRLGITRVLLPYMWDAPRDKVIADLTRNLELTQGVAEVLSGVLPFPVTVQQLSDEVGAVDHDWLTGQATERGRAMLETFGTNVPDIMKGMTPEDRLARATMESYLYLLDTYRFGQREGEERQKRLYVGLEVHGGYWEKGNLSVGPNGEYLPLAWMPKSVCQHWGAWVRKNDHRMKELTRLRHLLEFRGF